MSNRYVNTELLPQIGLQTPFFLIVSNLFFTKHSTILPYKSWSLEVSVNMPTTTFLNSFPLILKDLLLFFNYMFHFMLMFSFLLSSLYWFCYLIRYLIHSYFQSSCSPNSLFLFGLKETKLKVVQLLILFHIFKTPGRKSENEYAD